MTPYSKTSMRACSLALIAALLTACVDSSPERLMASAEAHLAKGDARAAVIELKSTLQQQPASAKARFLLGKAFLANAEPALAEIELRKSLELKQPTATVTPLLARALLDLGKHKELISQFGDTVLGDKQSQASLKTTLGWAHARSGQVAQADAAFKQALEAAPGYIPAQLAVARQQAGHGEHEAAARLVEGLIAAGKADADTWTLKGDLLTIFQRDREGALAAYRKALTIDKTYQPALVGIVTQLLAAGDTKRAGEQAAAWLKELPGNAMARYFQAAIAYEEHDFKTAKERVQQLLRGAPDNPQLNQLAGAIELVSGSVELSRSHLGKAVQGAPTSAMARHLLATAHLKLGEPAKALTALGPLLVPASQDARALMLAGEAHMQLRELDKAKDYFARANQANPNHAGIQTALARARFLKGDATGAAADLEQIAAADIGTVADLELVNQQMQRRDYKGALKTIDTLERKAPSKPTPMHLRGLAYLGLGEVTQARASLEKAMSLDATYFPAAANLAALDIADKKPLAAQQRFEAIIKKQPGNLRALLLLADLRARNGAPKEDVSELLTTAVRFNPNEPAAHLSLINNRMLNKQAELALSAAQQADAALPGRPDILDALGRAQLAAGQHHQALATFNKILASNPGNSVALMRAADVNIAMKDTTAAVQSLRRAVDATPDDARVQLRLIALELQAGRTAEALKLARELQKRHPAHSIGFVLEGDVHRASRDYEAALVSYKSALNKMGASTAAANLHLVLLATGKVAEAAQFANGWIKDHPKDVQFMTYVGDISVARRDLAGAEEAFRRIVEVQPDNVASLNNVAWLMVHTNKPGAVPFAEKANALWPNQPALMETLAVALAAESRLDEATKVQKKAIELAPDNGALRLSLARIHLQAGQKAQARDLLESLGKLGEKFPDHAEVKRLLAGL